MSDEALDIQITDILIYLGIPVSCKGYDYLRCSIILAYHSPDITEYITKTLYPKVARLCHASDAAGVERNCRHAVERACRIGRIFEFGRYFDCDITHRHPTCAQFISAIARRLHEISAEFDSRQ